MEKDEEYKDDFDSASTTPQEEAPTPSVSLASKTIDNVDLGTDEQHGFTLSPIHVSDMQTPISTTYTRSRMEQSSLQEEANLGSPSKHKMTAGMDEGKLLEKRSSKPSLLSAEELPPGGHVPQELNSSTESSTMGLSPSSLASGDESRLKKLAPLVPLSRDLVATTSEGVQSTFGVSGRDTYTLQSLDAEKPVIKTSISESTSTKSVSGEKGTLDFVAPVLLSVKGDSPALAKNTTGTPLRSTHITGLPPSVSDHMSLVSKSTDKKVVTDSLTAVTDIPNSSVGDIASQLADLRSPSLVSNDPPQATSPEPFSQPQTQLQASAASIASDLPHRTSPPLRDSVATEKLDQPETDSIYGDLDIQNIIRAITCEEMASIGKDILETKRKQAQSPPQVPKVAHKGKARSTAVGPTGTKKLKPSQRDMPKKKVGIQGREEKGETRQRAWQVSSQGQRWASRQKTGLSSSKESLASKSDLSVPRKPTSSKPKPSSSSSRGRDNSTIVPPKQPTKKSNFPQRSTKRGSSAGPVKLGRPRHVDLPPPESCHQPSSPPAADSPVSSPSSADLGVDFNTHLLRSPHQGKSNFERVLGMTNEPFSNEVLACIHLYALLL